MRPSNAKHAWRWASRSEAEITIENPTQAVITSKLAFGLTSITPDAEIKILLNDQLMWHGTVYDIRPVFIPAASLKPGTNRLTFHCGNSPVGPTSNDSRALCYAIYDLCVDRS